MELLQKIMKEESYSLTTFEYMILPKFTLNMSVDDSATTPDDLVYSSK